MAKRITAPFYTTKKTTLKGYLHGSALADGCLYAKGKYATKITAEDLPEHYIPGAIFKSDGYISVKGIKDIALRANYFTKHLHRDDHMFISYDKPIRKTVDGHGFVDYQGYDAVVYGGMIVRFIRAVREYGNYDIEPIAEEVKKKEKHFLEKYPEECDNLSKSMLLE